MVSEAPVLPLGARRPAAIVFHASRCFALRRFEKLTPRFVEFFFAGWHLFCFCLSPRVSEPCAALRRAIASACIRPLASCSLRSSIQGACQGLPCPTSRSRVVANPRATPLNGL